MAQGGGGGSFPSAVRGHFLEVEVEGGALGELEAAQVCLVVGGRSQQAHFAGRNARQEEGALAIGDEAPAGGEAGARFRAPLQRFLAARELREATLHAISFRTAGLALQTAE